MAGPFLEAADPSGAEGLDTLPVGTDVAVIGGGLAGAATARFLAAGGARVALLEARSDLACAASGRHLGLVTAGLIENAYRLEAALGTDRTRQLYAWSRDNRALLDAEGLLEPVGGWWVALDDRESTQLALSADVLAKIGVPVEAHPPEAVDRALGGIGLGPALLQPEDGLIDPAGSVRALAQRAGRDGARVFTGARALGFAEDADGLAVHLEGGHVLRTELVVLATNAWLPGLDRWFDDKIHPVREHALCTAPSEARLPGACRAGHGYTFWRQLGDGRVVAGGCRWATPHLELGETDDSATVPRIQERIGAFLQQYFPDVGALPVEQRWSWIGAQTCDGLPIVGPIPGAPRFIACAGFCTNEPGLGVRAARAVSDGILGTADPAVPEWMTPTRFV